MNKEMGLPSKFKLSTPYSYSNDVYESHKYDHEVLPSSYLKKKKTFSHDPKQVTHKKILKIKVPTIQTIKQKQRIVSHTKKEKQEKRPLLKVKKRIAFCIIGGVTSGTS